MAPSKRSSSSGNLKQGTLSFASVKRTPSSVPGPNGKGKSERPTGPRTLSIGSPALDSKASASSGGSTSDCDEGRVGRGAASRLSSRKRKHDQDDDPGVFRSREGAENVQTSPPVIREHLDTGDERWNKAFGAAREKMGHLEPIHSAGQTKVHQILRVFDLSYEYGPCIGVTRLERWERAAALGLNPPQEVHDILVTQEGTRDAKFAQTVFYEEV